jgi:hypothetical protein
MGDIKGYRELNSDELTAINNIKATGEQLGILVQQVRAMPDVDQRWASIGATDLQTGLMALVRAIAKPTSFVFAFLLLVGCVTPYKEQSGKFIKTSQAEVRSLFGTNQSFARLERCEGPEKKVLWYSDSDFTKCVMLTAAEQNEWEHGYSRGAGPELAGAAIMGGSIGIGAALSGGTAAASAGASATNIAVQTVTTGKHRR